MATASTERRRYLPTQLDDWLRAVTATHARAVAALLVVSLLAFLPGLAAVPPIDRDEARFAQATKQMLESGDYVDIRFQDDVRYKKPVGIYWLQAAAVRAAETLGMADARTTIWLYRLPSLLGAIGAVLLTYWTALAFVSRRAALFAGVMLATSVLLNVEARLAKTDAMLLLTIVAAMGVLGRIYLPEQRRRITPRVGWGLAAVFWTALAAGVLIKGPLILLFVGLAGATLSILDRSARWLGMLKPLPGIVWFALLVVPWFAAMLARSGDAFIAGSVGDDLLAKLWSSQESHGAPPGTYFALFWVTFWPGAVLAALAAPAAWAARAEPGAKFLLAWVLPAWMVFELVVTKLPHYVLPLYPAVAILTAGIVDAGMLTRRRLPGALSVLWFLYPAAVGAGAVVALVLVSHELGLRAWPLIAVAANLGLVAWLSYDARHATQSLLFAAGASICLTAVFLGQVVPALPRAFPSSMVADVLRATDCPQPLVAAAGYHEPSAVFLLGTETRLTNGEGAADFLREGDCRFAIVESRHERAFAGRASATGVLYSLVGRLDGFSYSNGKRVQLIVFRSGAPP